MVVVLAGAGSSYAIFAYSNNHTPSCSGYPPGGDCRANYSYTFTISVNYTGPWRLTYQGYASMAESNPTNANGNLTGNGPYSRPVTLAGPNNNGLTLCATAQKLDASDATLTVIVTGSNSISAPDGSVTYRGGVVP
jgi:hypothetical protein